MVKFKYLYLILISFVFVITGCIDSPETVSTNADNIFVGLIQDSKPASIKNLQGIYVSWLDYTAHLRFEASDSDINEIISQGYQITAWSEISTHFVDLSDNYQDPFDPAWQPEAIVEKECYVRDGQTCQPTECTMSYLVIDRKTGTVYYYTFSI
ncbi:MAG: hypothetical protein JEZ07_02205 [Phycisphaerae bacterium]|nr:hypothetical protein [Phycisphaerae bacterium]